MEGEEREASSGEHLKNFAASVRDLGLVMAAYLYYVGYVYVKSYIDVLGFNVWSFDLPFNVFLVHASPALLNKGFLIVAAIVYAKFFGILFLCFIGFCGFSRALWFLMKFRFFASLFQDEDKRELLRRMVLLFLIPALFVFFILFSGESAKLANSAATDEARSELFPMQVTIHGDAQSNNDERGLYQAILGAIPSEDVAGYVVNNTLQIRVDSSQDAQNRWIILPKNRNGIKRSVLLESSQEKSAELLLGNEGDETEAVCLQFKDKMEEEYLPILKQLNLKGDLRLFIDTKDSYFLIGPYFKRDGILHREVFRVFVSDANIMVDPISATSHSGNTCSASIKESTQSRSGGHFSPA